MTPAADATRVPDVTGISSATTVVGVIGDPVLHSLSPLLHNTAFAEMGLDWVSLGFPVPTGQAEAALAGMRALGIAGLSVTMPHKEAAAGLVDRTTPAATRLAAVNCITAVSSTRQLEGSNTDGEGFVAALSHGNRFEPRDRRCLVIGAGGAARAVVMALAEAGAAEVIVVNRSASRAVVAAALAGPVGRVGRPEDASTVDLVVNATPAGMPQADTPRLAETGGPTGTRFPLEPDLLKPGQVVVDLVYHPASTPWLLAARDRGAVTSNGLGMLVHQAAAQLCRWTGEDPPIAAMWRAATAALSAR